MHCHVERVSSQCRTATLSDCVKKIKHLFRKKSIWFKFQHLEHVFVVVFLQNRKHVCQRCIFINFCIRVKFLYVFVCFCVARFICIKFIVFIFYYWFVFVSNGSFKFVIVLSEKLSKKSKRIKLCGVFFRENCVRQRSM